MTIEHAILMHHNDRLEVLTQSQIISLVASFGQLRLSSELLYLLEPHILKNLQAYHPNALAKICQAYLFIG